MRPKLEFSKNFAKKTLIRNTMYIACNCWQMNKQEKCKHCMSKKQICDIWKFLFLNCFSDNAGARGLSQLHVWYTYGFDILLKGFAGALEVSWNLPLLPCFVCTGIWTDNLQNLSQPRKDWATASPSCIIGNWNKEDNWNKEGNSFLWLQPCMQWWKTLLNPGRGF